MTVMVPSDENECRQLLYTAFTLPGPAAVRYPRGTGPGVSIERDMRALPVGKAELCRTCGAGVPIGKRIALLAFGSMVRPALQAAETMDATVANMRFVKPLDADLVRTLAGTHDLLVSIEENVVMGGAGSAVLECLQASGITARVLQIGLPDEFVEHGDPAGLLAECRLNAEGIGAQVQAFLAG
jgi:1-deoxy-D-xylulose-5-phosphate synthase